MIIDAHVHAFPHAGSAAGYPDAATHLMMQQAKIAQWFGRMITSTADPRYAPDAGEDVGFRAGRYGRYYWTKQGRECWLQRFPVAMIEMEWTPEQMIASMDSIGVDKGVLHAGYMETNYNRRFTAECVKRWPDRFIGTVSVDYDVTRTERENAIELDKVREAADSGWARAVFQQTRGQKIDAPGFKPFWTELGRLRLAHFFATGFQPVREYLEGLDRIVSVLTEFSEVNGIIYHLGGNVRAPGHPEFTDTPTELLRLLRLPNVYFEAGYVLAYENFDIWGRNCEYPYPLHSEVIRRVYEEIGASRILWGSDMPNTYRTCTYRQSLDLVRLHMDFLADEEKQMVIGGNAARLFRV